MSQWHACARMRVYTLIFNRGILPLPPWFLRHCSAGSVVDDATYDFEMGGAKKPTIESRAKRTALTCVRYRKLIIIFVLYSL